MNIATAYVEIRAETDRFETDTVNAAERAGQKSGKTLAQNLAQVFAAGAFLKGMQESIESASNLNEQVNRTSLIFPTAKSVIDDYAKSSATSFGLSERAFRDATSSIGGLLQNLGFTEQAAVDSSVKLTQLAADLGSAFNTDPKDAIEAIGSALRGEAEPIRAYNVILDEAKIKAKAFELGLYSGKGAIDDNAKAQATLALITEQTAKVQGDFANTADGAANAQRIAKAEAENSAASLGQNFLPIYERVVQVVGLLAKGFGELPAPLQLATVGLIGVAALAGPVSKLKDVAKDVAAGIKAIGTAGKVAAGATAILGAGLLVYQALSSEKARLRAITDEFVESLKAEADGQKGATVAAIAAHLAQSDALEVGAKLGLSAADIAKIIQGESVPAWDALTNTLDENAKLSAGGEVKMRELEKTLGVAGLEVVDFRAEVDQLAGAMSIAQTEIRNADEVNRAFGVGADLSADDVAKATKAGAKFLAGMKDGAEAVGGSTDALQANSERHAELNAVQDAATHTRFELTQAENAAADAAKEEAEAQRAAAVAADKVTLKMGGLRDELADVISALDKLIGRNLTMEDANQRLYEGTEAVTESVTKNGLTLDLATEKGRANRDVIKEQVENILAHGAALIAQGASQAEATNAVELGRLALLAQMTQLGFTTAEAQAYVDQLGLTPDNIATAVSLANIEQMKAEIAQIIERLGPIDDPRETKIQALIDEGKYTEALDLLHKLEKDIKPRVLPQLPTSGPGVNYAVPTAQGEFFPGGSNAYRTIGEIPGRRGNEVVLPLGNAARMDALINGNPAVKGPILDTLGGDGAGVMSVRSGISMTNHFHRAQVTVDELSRAVILAGFQ